MRWLGMHWIVTHGSSLFDANKRLVITGLFFLLWAGDHLPIASAMAAEDVNGDYHFTLIHGRGIPVCDAYLERLNSVDYSKGALPFCDRPENTSVQGFEKLNRIPLTLSERNNLLQKVYNFTRPALQVDERVRPGFFSWSYQKIGAPIWRYRPEVNIENDGGRDDVVVWQGWGAEAGEHVCGSPYTASGGLAWRSVQQAYILTPTGDAIDEHKTHAVFWHETGSGLKPIGQSISIFEYKGEVYFDAFFYGPKSFDGVSDPKIADTLGVFLHQHGKTRQVCEYRMRDPELFSGE